MLGARHSVIRPHVCFPTKETDMPMLIAMLHDEHGATLVEYSLIVALIAAVCIGAVTALGSNASNKLNGAANALN